jgi:hypothetical protein
MRFTENPAEISAFRDSITISNITNFLRGHLF